MAKNKGQGMYNNHSPINLIASFNSNQNQGNFNPWYNRNANQVSGNAQRPSSNRPPRFKQGPRGILNLLFFLTQSYSRNPHPHQNLNTSNNYLTFQVTSLAQQNQSLTLIDRTLIYQIQQL